MQTALIVEDHISTAHRFEACLLQAFEKISIRQEYSLEGARRFLSGHDVDLVLLDMGLPDGLGLELLQENLFPAHSKVVVTTIFSDDNYVISALRAGACGYLLKDETEEDFIKALQGLLTDRPPLSSAAVTSVLKSLQTRPQPVPMPQLSPRETELLDCIVTGLSVRSAAEKMGVTSNTAAGYLKTIYQKLQVNNRAAVTRKALEAGLINKSLL